MLLDTINFPLWKVLKAVMMVSKGTGHYSAAVFKMAIEKHYSDCKLIPRGMQEEMECIQKWSLKMAIALRRLATWKQLFFLISIFRKWPLYIRCEFSFGTAIAKASGFRRNFQRAASAKLANIRKLKEDLKEVVVS